jgi:hypothetical protein
MEKEHFITRDQEELEGSLLPATVEAVPVHFVSGVATATAYPIEFFESASGTEVNGCLAYTTPSYATEHLSKGDELLRRAHRYGAMDVDRERAEIHRERQKVPSIDHAVREQVKAANDRARALLREEQQTELQGPVFAHATVIASENEKMNDGQAKGKEVTASIQQQDKEYAAELYGESYGKQYEVSPYDTGSYEVTEYKSVYDA